MAAFQQLHFHRLTPEQQTRRSEEFLQHMQQRRTIRSFSPEPIDLQLVENAIQAAATAPSGANQQPWRFVLVTDPAIKTQIRQAAEAEEKENYERRFPEEWLNALEPFGTDWHKEFLEVAPALIVMFSIDYGIDEAGGKRKHYYVQESVGIAAGMLLTALHWAGLATLTHTPSPMGFLRTILDRPPNERPYLVIPVGYPVEDCQVPVIQKKPTSEILIKL
jgi:nitroreductase